MNTYLGILFIYLLLLFRIFIRNNAYVLRDAMELKLVSFCNLSMQHATEPVNLHLLYFCNR